MDVICDCIYDQRVKTGLCPRLSLLRAKSMICSEAGWMFKAEKNIYLKEYAIAGVWLKSLFAFTCTKMRYHYIMYEISFLCLCLRYYSTSTFCIIFLGLPVI